MTRTRRTRHGHRTLAALGVVLASTTWSSATAQPPAPGTPPGVEVTPAKVEVDLDGRSFRTSILVVNHYDSARRIFLTTSGLGHDLDGTPRLLEPAPDARQMTISESELVLDAGKRTQVVVTGEIAPGRRALYGAVVAEFEPLDRTESEIDVESRVAAMFLIRGPRPWNEQVRVVDVNTLPAASKAPLTLFAAVKNTGNVHVNPRGVVRIKQGRRTLDVVRLRGETIIPGFSRRLIGTWSPPRGLNGTVSLEAKIRGPAATGRGSIQFSTGTVQAPGAKIENLVAHSGGGPVVDLVLLNTGTVAIEPEVTIAATEDGQARDQTVLSQETLRPGEARELQWKPKLEGGTYLITARVELDGRLLDQAVTGLEVTAASPLRWVALVLLVITALLLALWGWMRRRDRTMPAVKRSTVFPTRSPRKAA